MYSCIYLQTLLLHVRNMEVFIKLVTDIKSKGLFQLSKPIIPMASWKKIAMKRRILSMMFRVLHAVDHIWSAVYLFTCFKCSCLCFTAPRRKCLHRFR